jgi:hypothetical protein
MIVTDNLRLPKENKLYLKQGQTIKVFIIEFPNENNDVQKEKKLTSREPPTQLLACYSIEISNPFSTSQSESHSDVSIQAVSLVIIDTEVSENLRHEDEV